MNDRNHISVEDILASNTGTHALALAYEAQKRNAYAPEDWLQLASCAASASSSKDQTRASSDGWRKVAIVGYERAGGAKSALQSRSAFHRAQLILELGPCESDCFLDPRWFAHRFLEIVDSCSPENFDAAALDNSTLWQMHEAVHYLYALECAGIQFRGLAAKWLADGRARSGIDVLGMARTFVLVGKDVGGMFYLAEDDARLNVISALRRLGVGQVVMLNGEADDSTSPVRVVTMQSPRSRRELVRLHEATLAAPGRTIFSSREPHKTSVAIIGLLVLGGQTVEDAFKAVSTIRPQFLNDLIPADVENLTA